MNALLERLGLGEVSPLFDECYEKAIKENGIPEWLTEEYVRESAEEFPFFTGQLEETVSSLEEVVNNPDLVLFARVLYHMIGVEGTYDDVFRGIKFPEAPDGENTRGYDIFSFYPILARTRNTYRAHRDSGADPEILAATASGLAGCIDSSAKRLGRFGFIPMYFAWCTLHANGCLFKIDRFSFELKKSAYYDFYSFINKNGSIQNLIKDGVRVAKNGFVFGSAGARDEEGVWTATYRETDTAYEGFPINEDGAFIERHPMVLNKSEWTVLYSPGDAVISVHIPEKRAFDKEIIDSSFERARAFFKKRFPYLDIKAFVCTSWLLAPELKAFLKNNSNILYFQNLYTKFPILCQGLDVFNFVFYKSVKSVDEINIDELPGNTSLERAVKDLYKNSNFIHETGGIFKF